MFGKEGRNTRRINHGQQYLPQRLSSLFSLQRNKKNQEEICLELTESPPSSQFCNGYIAQPCAPDQRHMYNPAAHSDLVFQSLDAKALLAPQCHMGSYLNQENKSLISTPPSSIDLEWEHEVSLNLRSQKEGEEDSDSAGISLNNNFRSHHQYYKPTRRSRVGSRQGSITVDSSTGSKEGSRMTTPDSLEWDFIDRSSPVIDQETEQLLAEIERLAANALEETGNYLEVNGDTSLDREIC